MGREGVPCVKRLVGGQQDVLSESRRHFVFPHLKKFLHTFIDSPKPTVVAELGRYSYCSHNDKLALKLLKSILASIKLWNLLLFAVFCQD